ncbi:MAG TPA: hypothetical protein VNF51_02005 [Candidatus Paceibacterota bacterium]|nr:hypothetical protein [Candidatus Paceibacterota bacterium]
MLSQIFTFALGAASVFFFYENSFLIALVLFTWFLSRLFGYSLTKMFEGIGHSEVERQSNISIELKMNVAAILNHDSVSSLFDKLKSGKKPIWRKNAEFKFADKKAWVEQIVENYKKKYKNDNDYTDEKSGVRYVWESVKYNIKNNILWENGQVDFSDSITHEIFIPYEYAEDKEDGFFQDISEGIRIRFLVVNGMIKVQIGNFSKETSPQIYRDGLAVYKTWETITTFSLMYVFQGLPTNYLNLSMYATDSYKKLLSNDPSKDFTKDWKELNAEIANYNYLKTQFAIDSSVSGKFLEIYKKFNGKSLKYLGEEKFIDPYKRKDDDTYYEPGWMKDNSIHYLNNYLSVSIADYKDQKEKNEKYYYTDYHEETP